MVINHLLTGMTLEVGPIVIEVESMELSTMSHMSHFEGGHFSLSRLFEKELKANIK